ncbi:toll/interleukin-1 receptor domain-containing protein [Gimesia sp.]|uniref:toll/interleukin-1 receptor domain-containing protein n=1 Tax=Gimesia sp. TaxID=2024833 RepID=UPI003A95AEC1
MADPEHLQIVRQGAAAIFSWRQSNPDLDLDLSSADLSNVKLEGADLQGSDLNDADLSHANLIRANLSDADLISAKLNGTILSHANFFSACLEDASLIGAFLKHVDLSEASLEGADLRGADLSEADLENAYFTGADLSNTLLQRTIFYRTRLNGCKLCGATLTGATLSDVSLVGTDFDQLISAYNQWNNLDLSKVLHLETVIHEGPGSLGIDTLIRSQGTIPDPFLRGSGVPQHVISQIPVLFSRSAIPYDSCLIIQSSQERPFADWLFERLQEKGIRCWLDSDFHFLDQIYGAFCLGSEIAENVRILLCLSRKSLADHSFLSALDDLFLREKHRCQNTEPRQQAVIPLIIDEELFTDWNHPLRDQILELESISFSGWEKYSVQSGHALNQLVEALKTRAD